MCFEVRGGGVGVWWWLRRVVWRFWDRDGKGVVMLGLWCGGIIFYGDDVVMAVVV